MYLVLLKKNSPLYDQSSVFTNRYMMTNKTNSVTLNEYRQHLTILHLSASLHNMKSKHFTDRDKWRHITS